MKTTQQKILHHREQRYILYPRSRKKPREGEREVPLLDMVEVSNGGEEVPQRWRGRGAGWTADSDGGERPEELHQVGGGSRGEERVGGGKEL